MIVSGQNESHYFITVQYYFSNTNSNIWLLQCLFIYAFTVLIWIIVQVLIILCALFNFSSFILIILFFSFSHFSFFDNNKTLNPLQIGLLFSAVSCYSFGFVKKYGIDMFSSDWT